MTAETDLLPCPWCGEKLASVSVSEGSTFRWRKVDGCCADGPEVRHDTMADDQVAAEVESRAAAIAAWNRRANVAHATAPLQAEIEALREEIGRLLDSREREGDRLDWLLARLPGDVIRDLVGEMSCTSDVGEWRDRIDKAARFKPPTH